MTVIVDTNPLLTDCNTTTVTITGTNTLTTDLAAVFTDDEAYTLAVYTDGYKMNVEQVIANQPPSAQMNLGMCFSVNDPDSETAILGGYCVSYNSANTEQDDFSADSRTVSVMTATEWSTTAYTTALGTELTYAANGLINTPDDTAGVTDGHLVGNSIIAEWYQPEEADSYTGAFRVSATMTVDSWAISSSDGATLSSCAAAEVELTGAAALAMTSGAMVFLAIAY